MKRTLKEKIQVKKAYEEAMKRYESKDITGARTYLEEALKADPKDTELLNLLGLLHHLYCDFEKALRAWHKSISMARTGNKASEYLAYYSSEEFKTLQEVYMEGTKSLERKEYEKAYGIFAVLLDGNRNLVGVPLKMAECALGMKDKEKAKASLEEALLLDRNSRQAKELLSAMDNTQGAKMGLKRHPAVLLAVSALLMLALLVGFYQYRNLEKELQVLKQEQEALKKEAKGYQEEVDRLEALLQEMENGEGQEEPVAENEVPKEGPLTGTEVEIFEEGLAAYRAEDFEKAIQHFTHVAEKGTLDAYRSEAVYFLSATYKKLLNVEKVKAYYDQYMLEFQEGNYYAEVLYHYGLLLYEEGDLIKAQEILKKIPEEVPESPYNNSRVAAVLAETE